MTSLAVPSLDDVLASYHAAVDDFAALVAIELQERHRIGDRGHVNDIVARLLADDMVTPIALQRRANPAKAVAKLVADLHETDPLLFLGYPGRPLLALLLIGDGPRNGDRVAHCRANADRANTTEARRAAYIEMHKLIASGKPLPEPVRVFIETGGNIACAEAALSQRALAANPPQPTVPLSGKVAGIKNRAPNPAISPFARPTIGGRPAVLATEDSTS